MLEAVIVVVLVLTVAQAAVPDAEKVAVVAGTVAEAAVAADVKEEVAAEVSVIFQASAVKIAAEAMPVVVLAVKVATDADASN